MIELPRFCPHCGTEQQLVQTVFCTSCGKRKIPQQPAQVAPIAMPAVEQTSRCMSPLKLFFYAILAFTLLLVVAALFQVGGPSGGSGGSSVSVDNVSAFVMCKQFVTDRLKSPSTAEFPSMVGDGVNVRQLGATQFKVSAYVDSQNSFSAMIRTRHDCTVHNTGGPNWQLDNLVTDP